MNGACGMGAFLIVLILGITMIIQGGKRVANQNSN